MRALREAESKPPEARVGRYKKVFDHAREVFPNHSALLNRDRGGSLEKLSRAELIKETEKAFDNSHCFWYANTVADELRDRQMYEYAVPLLLSIINSKYNPGSGNVDAYKQVLDIFRMLGHHRDALALVTPARNHSKKDGFLLMYLGYLMRDMMLFEQAEKLFRAYVTAHPEQSIGSIFLVQTLLDQGKVHELYEFEKTPSWKKIPAKLQKLFKIRAQLQHSDNVQLKEKLLNELYNSRKLFRRDSYTVAFYSIAVIEALLADPDPTTSYYTYLLILNSIAPNSYYVYQLFKKTLAPTNKLLFQYVYTAKSLIPQSTFWKNEYTLFEGDNSMAAKFSAGNAKAKTYLEKCVKRDATKYPPYLIESLSINQVLARTATPELMDFWTNFAAKQNLSNNEKGFRNVMRQYLLNNTKNLGGY